jgi:hypothetical protein
MKFRKEGNPFMSNANSGIDAVMIECTLCGQWVHDACARIDAKKIKEEDPYLCGCDRIDNQFRIFNLLLFLVCFQ